MMQLRLSPPSTPPQAMRCRGGCGVPLLGGVVAAPHAAPARVGGGCRVPPRPAARWHGQRGGRY